jgi:hypothetical protein
MGTQAIHSILAGLPVFNSVLPGIKFFEPKDHFFKQMSAAYRGLHIYDVGAGMGHVALGLALEGLTVTALDLILREKAEFPVVHTNAVGYRYPQDAVLMFCRPCHNEFVEATISRGLGCGVQHFVYAGLAKNVNSDLGRFRRDFVSVARKIGHDGESLYVMGKSKESWAGSQDTTHASHSFVN